MSSRECNVFEAMVVPESGGEFCHVPALGTRMAPLLWFVSHRFTLRSLLTTASGRQPAGLSSVTGRIQAREQAVQLGEQAGPRADSQVRAGRAAVKPGDLRAGLAGD